jgi:hypothetical protein
MDTDYHINKVREIIELELIFTCTDKTDDHWLSALSIRINDLILNNFDKLIFVLYRLDINELNLIKLLKNYPDSDAGKLIGELIIERQLQKIKTREAFRQDDINIDENEKW